MPTREQEQSVVLASAGLLAGDREGMICAWADARGWILLALPEAGYRAHPDAGPAERRRLGRRDFRELAEVLHRLCDEHGPRTRIVAFLVTADEVAGQAGRAWRERLGEAAAEAGLELPRTTRVADAADLEHDDIGRRLSNDVVGRYG